MRYKHRGKHETEKEQLDAQNTGKFKFAIRNLIKLLEKDMKKVSIAFIFGHCLVSLADESFQFLNFLVFV